MKNLFFIFFLFIFILSLSGMDDDIIKKKLEDLEKDSEKRIYAKDDLDKIDISIIQKYVNGLLKQYQSKTNEKISYIGVCYLKKRNENIFLEKIAEEGLLSSNDNMRALTAQLLETSNLSQYEKLVKLLKACLNDKSSDVRVHAAFALLRHAGKNNTRTMSVLLEELDNTNLASNKVSPPPYTIEQRIKSFFSYDITVPKIKLLKSFYKNTDNEIIRYQILDILAFIDRQITHFIYSDLKKKLGEEKKKTLDKYKYLLEKN